MALSSDCALFATAGDDGVARVWRRGGGGGGWRGRLLLTPPRDCLIIAFPVRIIEVVHSPHHSYITQGAVYSHAFSLNLAKLKA